MHILGHPQTLDRSRALHQPQQIMLPSAPFPSMLQLTASPQNTALPPLCPPTPLPPPCRRMYLQKHGGHRPAELIRLHLERLDRERAATAAERRAAMIISEGAPTPLVVAPEGVQAMEEDGGAPGAHLAAGASGVGAGALASGGGEGRAGAGRVL